MVPAVREDDKIDLTKFAQYSHRNLQYSCEYLKCAFLREEFEFLRSGALNSKNYWVYRIKLLNEVMKTPQYSPLVMLLFSLSRSEIIELYIFDNVSFL